MEFEVSGNLEQIEIGATGNSEIIQNLKVILSTYKGSVPLNRNFGFPPTPIDLPMEAAEAVVASEVVDAISKYEPRVDVKSIDFLRSEDGLIKPVVKVIIKEV